MLAASSGRDFADASATLALFGTATTTSVLLGRNPTAIATLRGAIAPAFGNPKRSGRRGGRKRCLGVSNLTRNFLLRTGPELWLQQLRQHLLSGAPTRSARQPGTTPQELDDESHDDQPQNKEERSAVVVKLAEKERRVNVNGQGSKDKHPESVGEGHDGKDEEYQQYSLPIGLQVEMASQDPSDKQRCAILVYMERKRIFARLDYSLRPGLAAVALGMAGYWAVRASLLPLSKTDRLAFMALSMVVVWIGGFICTYGMRALKAAAFPALFLLLMIPIPDFILNRLIYALQKGSAEVTYALFRLVGVPVLKQGFEFLLPGVNIKVARECSGIRSSLALLIASLLAGHFFLRSAWRKLWLTLMVVPITIFKNAVRIATISLLSVYVDKGFLTGNLHHHGGIPFSIIAVAMLVPLLWLLQKSERRSRAPGTAAARAARKPAAEIQATS